MVRITLQKVSFNNKNKIPMLIFKAKKQSHTFSIPIDPMHLPDILSILYNLKFQNDSFFPLIYSLKKISLTEFKKIILKTKNGNLYAELHFSYFLFFNKKVNLSVSDAVIFSLLEKIPIFAEKEILTVNKKNDLLDKPIKKLFLETWDPDKLQIPAS